MIEKCLIFIDSKFFASTSHFSLVMVPWRDHYHLEDWNVKKFGFFVGKRVSRFNSISWCYLQLPLVDQIIMAFLPPNNLSPYRQSSRVWGEVKIHLSSLICNKIGNHRERNHSRQACDSKNQQWNKSNKNVIKRGNYKTIFIFETWQICTKLG